MTAENGNYTPRFVLQFSNGFKDSLLVPNETNYSNEVTKIQWGLKFP